MLLCDFSNSDTSEWIVVNDVVMGGRSDGGFFTTKDGTAIFKGYVSLENNGGFSMAKYQMHMKKVPQYSKLVMKIKGDGKRYQFRLKSNATELHSYVQYFQTNGEWQIIELELAGFYPTFRGRKLNLSNFPMETLEEIAVLIGNKKAEDFSFQIKWIALQ
jgi:hypothetical protein